MSSTPIPDRESAADLLADAYSVGLDDLDHDRLAALLADDNGDAAGAHDAMQTAAAAAALALLPDAPEELPDHLATELNAQADRFSESRRAGAQTSGPAIEPAPETYSFKQAQQSAAQDRDTEAAIPVWAWGSWVAAAACLLVAVFVSIPGEPASVTEQRAAFLQSATDLITADWAGIDDAQLAEAAHRYDNGITGQVEWSDADDQGFMVIEGLAANDPDDYQYQLWIFDAERPTGDLPDMALPGLDILSQRPVDGGVFDAAPDKNGKLIVPINPAITVGKAAIFAITAERPGGVVVSDRSELVFLALAP